MAKVAAPSKLGAKARRVWTDINSTYDLRADELRILEDACREIDLVERLEKELAGASLIVTGSMKQPVANPLVQEIRQHRTTLKQLLGAIDLPDDPAEPAPTRSVRARAAAEARWKRGA
jgi:hypothetical protein